MVEMSESIENFELLLFEVCTHVPDSATDGGVLYSSLVSPALIKQYYKFSMVAFQTSYSNNYFSRIGIGFYDSTHLAICWANYVGWSHNASKLKVLGIGRINSTP